MVLDVLTRYLPSLKYVTVGRSIYTNADSRPLPNRVEVWQGYYQSARPAIGKLILNNNKNKDKTKNILIKYSA
jgi:hypothetical protein